MYPLYGQQVFGWPLCTIGFKLKNDIILASNFEKGYIQSLN